jgi:hypothetical protein
MLSLARTRLNEAYENVLVPKSNPNWHGPWDCAEFMSWLVFQDAGFLYGCIDNNADPATADAYTGAWQRDAETRGIRVPINQAAATAGGFVLRYPPVAADMGHIAICDGRGGTVEAKGHAFGVVTDTVHGRRWDTGVLLPGVQYGAAGKLDLEPPPRIYYVGAADLDPDAVRNIQLTLSGKRFDPGPVDGIFGANTALAVAAFQRVHGLVMDGEVGPQTASALGVTIV